jgi:hypothetical protein
MATVLDEVVAYLSDEDVGTFGTDLFIGYEPQTPKNVVTLYPTGGRSPSPDMDKEYPTIQVRVRNETYPDGWSKAVEIYHLLHTQEQVLETLRGRCFALQGSPMFIGHGENGEFIFTQNFVWYIATNPDS